MNRINIPLRRLRAGVVLPAYRTIASSGMDLSAQLEEVVTLEPGARALIPTGVAIALPKGYEAQVRPRSGLALRHGVTVLNAPGTVDSDYRGEIKVLLVNHGREPYKVLNGDRVAQLVVAPVASVSWLEKQELPETDRGDGGFGHTGR